jgi:TIR domain
LGFLHRREKGSDGAARPPLPLAGEVRVVIAASAFGLLAMSSQAGRTLLSRLDSRESERKLTASRAHSFPMTTVGTKPVIFISDAHADEPENPRDGEVQWLTFVTDFLKSAEQRGEIEVWTDRLMPGGADWNQEIEDKVRGCDVFILLISHNSLASDYVVDKEIAIIRERQAKGEDVHFYPLLMTPTPGIGLEYPY